MKITLSQVARLRPCMPAGVTLAVAWAAQGWGEEVELSVLLSTVSTKRGDKEALWLGWRVIDGPLRRRAMLGALTRAAQRLDPDGLVSRVRDLYARLVAGDAPGLAEWQEAYSAATIYAAEAEERSAAKWPAGWPEGCAAEAAEWAAEAALIWEEAKAEMWSEDRPAVRAGWAAEIASQLADIHAAAAVA